MFSNETCILSLAVAPRPTEYKDVYLPTGKVKPPKPGMEGETIWLKPVERVKYERRESREDYSLKEVRYTQQREIASAEREWEEKNVYPFWRKKPAEESKPETIFLKPAKIDRRPVDEPRGETIWLKPVERERYIVTEPEQEPYRPPPAKRPLFLTQLNNIPRLPERQRAVFECQVEPADEPTLRIEWYHNGKPIHQGTSMIENIC